MFRLRTTQERILHRLKISRGHLDKVIEMVEKGEYCIDVLHQSQAVQSALKEADHVILEKHLKTCAADAIKSGKQDKVIPEIMEVVKKSR